MDERPRPQVQSCVSVFVWGGGRAVDLFYCIYMCTCWRVAMLTKPKPLQIEVPFW